MLRLSELLGAEVRLATGAVAGRVVDLTVQYGSPHPPLRAVGVGRGRHVRSFAAWDTVTAFELDGIELAITDAAMLDPPGQHEADLRLRRDVLDTQVVDLAGKRIARVADVQLEHDATAVRAVAAELGGAGVWRRFGLPGIAQRLATHTVDWDDLHLTSSRGHALQMESRTAAVHRLSGEDLAALLPHLPTATATSILETAPPTSAAGALAGAHPRIASRLLRSLPTRAAGRAVEQMPTDDAAALLRSLDASELDSVLAHLEADRAATLRKLLTHPAQTAGALMNPHVVTATPGEAVDAIRERVGQQPSDAIIDVVFDVDDGRRPIAVRRAADLLAGRDATNTMHIVPASLPLHRLVDQFAMPGVQVVAVVDEDGRLTGAITESDILDEILAERLPGGGRFGLIRRRPHHRSRRAARS